MEMHCNKFHFYTFQSSFLTHSSRNLSAREQMGGPLGAIIGRYPAGGDREGQSGDAIIRRDRKCRDLVFLFIFIAFWVAMIVNSSLGFDKGDPLRCLWL